MSFPMCGHRLAGCLLALTLAPMPLAAQRGVKVYISADMEGVTGVVTVAPAIPTIVGTGP